MAESSRANSTKRYGKVASGLIRSLSLEEVSIDGSDTKNKQKPSRPTRKKATPVFEDVSSSPTSTPKPPRALLFGRSSERDGRKIVKHKVMTPREGSKDYPVPSRSKSPIRSVQFDDSDEAPPSTLSTVHEDEGLHGPTPPKKRRTLPWNAPTPTSQSSALTKTHSNVTLIDEPRARQRLSFTTQNGSPATSTITTPKTRILPWNRPPSTTPAQTNEVHDVPMLDASLKEEGSSPSSARKRTIEEVDEEPTIPQIPIEELMEESASDSDESENEDTALSPFMLVGHQLNTHKPPIPPEVKSEPLSVKERFNIKTKPVRYWDGQIGHTFLSNPKSQQVNSQVPIWSIEDVLGHNHLRNLKTAIISTYELDIEFASHYFPPGKIPTVMIAPRGYKAEIEKTRIVDWVLPELPGEWKRKECFHMKFMLLFYQECLRIVIGSPNLIYADWNTIENTLWIQDVPLRNVRSSPVEHPFTSSLIEVLEQLGVQKALKPLNRQYPLATLDDLSDLHDNYGWTRVKVALVHSFAGQQNGWNEVSETGQFRLRRALKEIKARCPGDKELLLECQTSEMGFRYGGAWLNQFYDCAMGLSPMNRWGESRSEKQMVQPSRPPIKILYPGLRVFKNIWSLVEDELSTTDLLESVRTYRAGKGWLKSNYPRDRFYSQRSVRGKEIFIHTKMIIAIFKDKRKGAPQYDQQASKSYLEGVDPKVGGWVYLGSHNFTPGAWGRIGGTASEPKQYINNYELGIVFPLPSANADDEASRVACWDRKKLTRYDMEKD